MTFCLRAGRTISPGRRLLCHRAYRSPYAAEFVSLHRRQSVSRVHTSSGEATSSNGIHNGGAPNRLQSPFPQKDDEIARWIWSLEEVLPLSLGGKVEETGNAVRGTTEVRFILGVLQRARKTDNLDLLAHLGFKLNRWNAVHYVVNRLLDEIRTPELRPGPHCLPSNINWRHLGIQNWDSIGYLDELTWKTMNKVPSVPVVNTESQSILSLVESDGGQAGESEPNTIRDEIMGEIWQSLGLFILEAADLLQKHSSAAMEHVFQILGRLQHLDLIPHNIYNDAASQGLRQCRSRAGVPYMQNQIMNTLADSSLEAAYAEATASSVPVALRPPRRRYKILRRELGAGTWLEFILYCCIEDGFFWEAHRIVDQMQRREKEWHVKSWSKMLDTSGAIDPKRVDYFDTWAECGQNATESRLFMSRKPFQGMGERTIASEPVVSLMDGLIDSATDLDSNDKSFAAALKKIGSLRSFLESSGLRLGSGDVNYFLTRVIESQVVEADINPHSLGTLLHLIPYTETRNKGDGTAETTTPAVNHGHGASTLVLGLHSYALNSYASHGNISGMVDAFEKLIGALDFRKVLEMRRLALDDKYQIKASPTRYTEDLRRALIGEKDFDILHRELLCHLLSWPTSLSLFLDAVTVSGNYRLGNWLLNANNDQDRLIPTEHFSDPMLAPALIRFAASTKDKALFSTIGGLLKTPVQREILKAVVTYQVTNLNWDTAVALLEHLTVRHKAHWGATNVAAVAAMVIRLEHASELSTQSSPKGGQKAHLARAKGILAKLLEGKFNRNSYAGERYRYQQHELYQLHRLLSSLPGSLQEVCQQAKLQWNASHNPPEHIVANAFHHILSAVVGTQGSLAGKRLWDRWCIDPFSALAQQVRIGPNAIFQPVEGLRRAHRSSPPDTHADSASESENLVVPNANTVRIIALRAVQELAVLKTASQDSSPSAKDDVTDLLGWCVRMFKAFGFTEVEIERELGDLQPIYSQIAARSS